MGKRPASLHRTDNRSPLCVVDCEQISLQKNRGATLQAIFGFFKFLGSLGFIIGGCIIALACFGFYGSFFNNKKALFLVRKEFRRSFFVDDKRFNNPLFFCRRCVPILVLLWRGRSVHCRGDILFYQLCIIHRFVGRLTRIAPHIFLTSVVPSRQCVDR
jgi:hypothetical protein